MQLLTRVWIDTKYPLHLIGKTGGYKAKEQGALEEKRQIAKNLESAGVEEKLIAITRG